MNPNRTAYILSEGGLISSLHKQGYNLVNQNPYFVVVLEGRNFTLEIVNNAFDTILSESKLIATNLNLSPKKKGWMNLGIKSIVSMLEEATGKMAGPI